MAKKERLNLRLDKDMFDKVKAHTIKKGITVTKLITDFLIQVVK